MIQTITIFTEMSNNKTNRSIAAILIAAVLTVSVLLLCGCTDRGAAEAAVASDLEDMRYVEIDGQTDSELENLLSDQGREYYEIFLGKAGEYDFKITGSDTSDTDEKDAVIVHVHITTYDFGSEYLRSWSEFLEASEKNKAEAAEKTKKDKKSKKLKKSGQDTSDGYDSAMLYETLFRNLSNVQNKTYNADVDITCTMDGSGAWQTDARRNVRLRNAILGGMLDEVSSLAGLGVQ